ncbi:OsmC family protein [Marinospirillum alkaliphilum]|uniref:Putative redox protein n=1 Tax=Marinospirillum alkaliphilum DSM 21637 TaxID=1122209 RepID=A0A1K1ZDF4_9GAMM|nr:OsmC family protein [Marinospirillum alkaliphilum]SFX72282.1 putative redox protein [Marinospirillum alkaliphilum DSM 21637]
MQAKIKWTDGVQFIAESGTGHAVVVDGPPDSGGRNTGPRPMELVLMGLGACSSYDVVSILKKSRQDITDCHTELKADRVDAIPAVFSKIHLHFVVSGRDLKPAQVERAVKLSAEKYCSASIMLGNAGVEITHSHEIISV